MARSSRPYGGQATVSFHNACKAERWLRCVDGLLGVMILQGHCDVAARFSPISLIITRYGKYSQASFRADISS